MSYRTIRRDDWKRVLEKDVLIQDFSRNGMTGKIALMLIRKVSSPLSIDYGSEKVTIVDEGYSWVQIAPEGKYYWLTSMFDENDRLLEIYIDMTDGNVTDTDDPYFEDLYLDYVVHGSAVEELDRDELTEARKAGRITQEQYERTLSEGAEVMRYLTEKLPELKDLLVAEQQRMKKELNP